MAPISPSLRAVVVHSQPSEYRIGVFRGTRWGTRAVNRRLLQQSARWSTCQPAQSQSVPKTAAWLIYTGTYPRDHHVVTPYLRHLHWLAVPNTWNLNCLSLCTVVSTNSTPACLLHPVTLYWHVSSAETVSCLHDRCVWLFLPLVYRGLSAWPFLWQSLKNC